MNIEIGNAHSSLIGCSADTFKKISDRLSFEMPGAEYAASRFSSWDGKIRLLKPSGVFPTGLLPLVYDFLKQHKIEAKWFDKRTKPRAACGFELIGDWIPREYQNEALNVTEIKPRGVFVLGTGGGKSLLMAMITAAKKVPTLVVTPDKGLRDQFYETAVKTIGKGVIGKSINEQPEICITNFQALARAELRFFQKYQMLLIDEFHHAASKTYQDINKNCINAYFRYGFTGTFLRTDGMDLVMHGVLSNVIFKKTTSELIEEGFLVRPTITFYQFGLKGAPRDFFGAYNFIVEDVRFNQMVGAIASEKANKEDKQTLVLVKRKSHGELLQSLVTNSVYVSGDDPVEKREHLKKLFNDKKIKCLIATNVFGEGTDIPSIDCLINARLEKTEIQTKQGVGRALRKAPGKVNADVFDFFITKQKHLMSHSQERLQTYSKEPSFLIKILRYD